MTLALTQSATAVGVLAPASFLAVGGTEPYVYSIDAGGAGGTIDPDTGAYVAPAVLTPGKSFDTVRVTDDDATEATTTILVGSPLLLFCDIIQSEMGLANGRVYLWDQKIMQPTDSGVYVAVSVVTCKPFANVNRATDESQQYLSMMAQVDVDIISRGPAARDRKEEVLLALGSTYSEQQQTANGFYIARLPPGMRFINLSNVDGAAIPYRYKISVNIQYCFTKNTAIEYYDDFSDAEITVNP